MISSNWETKKLNDICVNISTNKKRIKQKNYEENADLPVIDQGDELIGGYTSKIKSKVDCSLPAIVFGDHTKAVKYINFDFAPGADGIKVLEPKESIHPKYLFYLLKRMVFEIPDKGYARHFQYLNKESYPVPPLPTQHRIVEKIEELFSELDNGVENLKKAQKQLNTYRQAVLKDAFEGKLTAEWREQQTDLPTPEELLQQIKAERKAHRQRELAEWEKEVEKWEKDGEPGRKPRKPTKLSKLDEDSISNNDGLPKGWFYIPFEQIGYWQGGGTPSKRNEEFWENGTVAWVSPKDMKRKNISETEDYITENAIENSSAKWIKKGSILFVVRSGILRRILPVAVAKKDLTVNQDLQAFTSVTRTLPDYLYWYAFGNENAIRNSCAKDGTTVESIDSSSLKAYPVPFCSIKEQRELVNEIESRLSVVDQLERTIKENLQKAEALRQSILKKAFGGELVVR
ncbi:MAG: restriction endonuclease subunit S [Gracilimonas sp.]